MKAITYTAFGGPEVIEVADAPVPDPGHGEIRVTVRAAGLNPYDTKVRAGMFGGTPPGRLGLEIAGTVDALGDGVADVSVGDPVFGQAAGGGLAEYAISAAFAPIPAGLAFPQAAALPVAIETAARTLDALGVTQDTRLLVNGGSGAVGIAATQLARIRGAAVVSTAGARNQDFVRSLGAEPVTYGDGVVERVRAFWPGGADRALDANFGGLPALIELTGDAAHVLTISDFAAAGALGVATSGGPDDTRATYIFAQIGPLIAGGAFTPVPVAATFPLAQTARAYAALEGRHAPGKIVVTVD